MGIKEWLCNFLGCCEPESGISPPTVVGSIEYTELYSTLKAEFGMDVSILLSDYHYKLATKESFEEFLSNDNTNNYKYTGDPGIDCDNMAEILAGRTAIPGWGQIPIGTCWLSKPAHAINIFVDENKDIYYCEPQNDMLYLVSNKTDWKASIIWI